MSHEGKTVCGGLVSITLFHLTTIGSRGGRESIHYVPSNEKRAVTVIVVVVVCLFVCLLSVLFCFLINNNNYKRILGSRIYRTSDQLNNTKCTTLER